MTIFLYLHTLLPAIKIRINPIPSRSPERAAAHIEFPRHTHSTFFFFTFAVTRGTKCKFSRFFPSIPCYNNNIYTHTYYSRTTTTHTYNDLYCTPTICNTPNASTYVLLLCIWMPFSCGGRGSFENLITYFSLFLHIRKRYILVYMRYKPYTILTFNP